MEKSGKKKSDAVKIPKRSRSLDLQSLYKPRVSKGGESKGKVSQGTDQQNVGKKRRSKEVSLSQFEPDAKKSKEEDVNDENLELDSSQNLGGGSEGLHGISLPLGGNGSAFSFPKRPRGRMGRKKLETDQVPNPLELPESGDPEGAFNAGINDEAGTSGKSVELDTFSVGSDGLSKSKPAGKVIHSNIKYLGRGTCSNSKSAGKVGNSKSKSRSVGKVADTNSKAPGKIGDSNSKPQGKVTSSDVKLKSKSDSQSTGKVISPNVTQKLKSDSKSTGKVINSNIKLKRKAGTDEFKESGNGGSGSMCDAAKENIVAVNSGGTSAKKRRTSSKKKMNSVDGEDGGEISKKTTELSVGGAVADKIGADFDGGDKEGNCEEDGAKENVVAVNSGDTTSRKQRTFSRKKKDLVEGKGGIEASKKKSEPSVGNLDFGKIVADFDEDDCEANLEKIGWKESDVGVNSGDTSKKRQTNNKKKNDLIDGKDGGKALKKKSEPSVGTSVSHKIVAHFDEYDCEANLEKIGGKENAVGVNSGDTSKKRRTNNKNKKDLIDGKDGGKALKKKSEPSVGTSVSHKIVADFDEDNCEANLEQNSGKESAAVNTGDMSSKKRRSNIKKNKALLDGKDDEGGSTKSEPSVSHSVSDKIVAGFDGEDDDETNLKQDGGNGTSSKKRRANSRKKNDLVDGKDGGEASGKKPEPCVATSVSDMIVADFDEDDEDEENLEENAARMLSSRFDPSCTGFPSKRKSSASQKANESSFPESSTLDSLSQQINSSGGVDAEPVGDDSRADDQRRALRPRREDKGKVESSKGEPRKRRHFYEIPLKDMEPQWVLDRKIKVFWPLDESWYYGQVNAYHPECKLYHIKYDDRDEEWVDLKEETFKLLLYPSEVPGRDKSKKFTKVRKGVHKARSFPPEHGDNSKETDLDTETIASWLARSSQRGKSSPKSLQSQGTSNVELPTVASGSCLETDHLNIADEPIVSVTGTLNTAQRVYARKRSQTSSEGNGAMSRYVKAYENASDTVDPVSVTVPATEKVDSEKQVWSIDHQGNLWLDVRLVESKKLTFQICLLPLPCWESSLQTADSSLLHDLFMDQHGVLLPTSSSVALEMLLIDSYRGLKFFLFEGCNKQALAFIFEMLNFCSQAGELVDRGMQSPVTSIRFRLSGVQDRRKLHVFELHSFSRLQNSKWVCLDSRLLQHCLLLKTLPASECTYDNLKELERWSLQQCESQCSSQLSSHAGLNKESTMVILPSGVSRLAYTTRTRQSALYLSEKPGEVSTIFLFSSVAPTFLLTKHLQILMENSAAAHQCEHDLHEQRAESLPAAVSSIPSQASDHGGESGPDLMIVDISSTDQVHVPIDGEESISRQVSDVSRNVNEVHVPLDGKESISRQASDVARNENEDFDQNPDPTGARSSLQGGRTSTISTPPADRYPKWTDGTPKFMRRGFSSGPKKPRSLVQYALPGPDHDFSAEQKMQNQRSVPGKRIKRDSLKRISDASGGNRKNYELLVCDANVLVTQGDRGWRECGALIVLEVAEHNEWRLAVKLSGITKYAYKVNHILQPGSTNRYSHAVLWKGGKDWVLEFVDRNQWNLFKEMHEECYNRNVRAASVKNIPIPGVLPIEDCDDYGFEAPFVRNPTKYIRQLQNDVEMAMDPSHVLYDMDSDDEQWLISNQECGNEKGFEEMSEDIFEKTMDIFEKASYVKHRDNFAIDELQELAAGMGSVELVKLIYDHWGEKRGSKGMPLIRHLQPPLWESYQLQVKEWEKVVGQGNPVTPAGIQEKAPIPEKPAMFAFCLKPRGLEIRNKSFKQKSHRKYPASAHLHPSSGNHSRFFIYGNRSSGDTYPSRKVLYRPDMHDSSNVSSLPPPMRLLSPRDAHYHLTAAAGVASPSPRVYRTKQKKHGRHPSSDNQQTASCRRRKVGRKNGVQQRNMGLPDSSCQMDLENMDDSDLLNQCRLRDASAAAQHALEVAKMKRERAQRLFEKADVAVQKAVAAIMTAEAIKGECEAMNGGS